MPAKVKLSKRAHEQFGAEIATELEEIFDSVVLNSRAELRDLSDLSFARFDARLEQRLAEQTGILRQEMAEMGAGIRQEMAVMGAGIRTEMAEMGAGIRTEMAEMGAGIRTEMAEMGAGIRTEMAVMGAGIRTEMAELGGEIRKEIANEIVKQTRWLVALWAAQITIFVGTVFVVLQGR